ncbi:hypothetical protein ACJRO7_009943 [Eucalyptus globulus]|uniref:TF-B3 domain-containing protein n=1 Tax=Eucalyptus globulus TaxID=34317 RepID=A0ABD3LB47_EUCGL
MPLLYCEVDKSSCECNPSRRSIVGETEMEVNPLFLLAKISELVREGLVSVSPEAQTRPIELPEIFWDKILQMHGQGVRLVLQKKLCASDMDQDKGRLSIPMRQTQEKFLTSEEIQALDNKKAITVSLIEPCLHEHRGLHLKKWHNRTNHFSYVLSKGWTAVTHPFERNKLQVDDLVQLWAFRAYGGDLCFCLVKVEAPPAAVENVANHE